MVTRETPVSNQMLRSLCGCRTNQVDDKNSVLIPDYRDTVFVYTSHKVLSRYLVGAFLSSLEKTNLKMVQAVMLKPSLDTVKKSSILKKVERNYQNEVCLISLWRGEDSFKHVQNAISRFCMEYAFVQGVDIAMTDSTKSTRKEAELWMTVLIPAPAPVVITAENNVGEIAPTTNDLPPNLEEEVLTPGAENDAPLTSPNEVHDPEDVVLVRESSTADTLPVGDKPSDPPQELIYSELPAEARNELPAHSTVAS